MTVWRYSLFVERIVDKDGSHLKGYAGEVLTLLAFPVVENNAFAYKLYRGTRRGISHRSAPTTHHDSQPDIAIVAISVYTPVRKDGAC